MLSDLVSDPPWSRWYRSKVSRSNGDLPMDVTKNEWYIETPLILTWGFQIFCQIWCQTLCGPIGTAQGTKVKWWLPHGCHKRLSDTTNSTNFDLRIPRMLSEFGVGPPWSRWHRSQVTSSNGDLPMDCHEKLSDPQVGPVDSQRARHQIWQHFWNPRVKISGVLCVTHFFVTSTVSHQLTRWPWSGANGSTEGPTPNLTTFLESSGQK